MNYKDRLAALEIPAWRFYDAKSHYAKEQELSKAKDGKFLQLVPGGTYVPMPSFASTTGRRPKPKKSDAQAQMMSIELRAPNMALFQIVYPGPRSVIGRLDNQPRSASPSPCR